MEFRRGSHELRQDRRICPRCETLTGNKPACPKCGGTTKPRIQIYWYIHGARHRSLTSCWREADANEVLQRKESDYWRQQDLGVSRAVGGTLKDARDAFVEQLNGCSAEYRKQIDTALSAFADGVGWEQQVHLIAKQDINDFRNDGLTARSPATVRSYMLVLRRLFGWLHEEGWIRSNPTRKVTLPAPVKRRDCLRPEEVGPVLSSLWASWPDIAPIVTTTVLGGWRKGEIVNLRHGDVYLDEGWAYVLNFEGDARTEAWSPKTESSARAVPLHPLVAEALRRVEPVTRWDGQVSPWVFPVVDGRKRRRYTDNRGRLNRAVGDRRSPATSFFGKKLNEALRAAGVHRHVTIHGLRRTFAVLLQDVGAPDSVISEALGHAATGVTHAHYLPRRNELVKRWVEKIDVRVDALQRAPKPGGSAHPPIIPQLGAKQPPALRLVT